MDKSGTVITVVGKHGGERHDARTSFASKLENVPPKTAGSKKINRKEEIKSKIASICAGGVLNKKELKELKKLIGNGSGIALAELKKMLGSMFAKREIGNEAFITLNATFDDIYSTRFLSQYSNRDNAFADPLPLRQFLGDDSSDLNSGAFAASSNYFGSAAPAITAAATYQDKSYVQRIIHKVDNSDSIARHDQATAPASSARPLEISADAQQNSKQERSSPETTSFGGKFTDFVNYQPSEAAYNINGANQQVSSFDYRNNPGNRAHAENKNTGIAPPGIVPSGVQSASWTLSSQLAINNESARNEISRTVNSGSGVGADSGNGGGAGGGGGYGGNNPWQQARSSLPGISFQTNLNTAV